MTDQSNSRVRLCLTIASGGARSEFCVISWDVRHSPDTDRITVELPPPDGDDTIGHEDDDPTERL